MMVEADEEDTAAKDVADEEVGEEAEKEVKQQTGWMMMTFMRCLRMHGPSTSKNAERKVSAVSGKGGNGKGSKAPITKRQIQEIATNAVASSISAMIAVDPDDQEGGPSANAGDKFGGKRNQIQSKIMQLKSSASMAQNKQMIMNSLQAKK
jgi:hypothetical protein